MGDYSEDKKMWFRFLDPGGFIHKETPPEEKAPTYLGAETLTDQASERRAEKSLTTQPGIPQQNVESVNQQNQQSAPQQGQQPIPATGQMQNQESMNIQRLIAGLTNKDQAGPTSFSITPGKTGGYSYKIDGMAGNSGEAQSQVQAQATPTSPQMASPQSQPGTTDDFLRDYGG